MIIRGADRTVTEVPLLPTARLRGPLLGPIWALDNLDASRTVRPFMA